MPTKTRTKRTAGRLAIAAAMALAAPAAAQVRIVSYNVAQLNGNLAALTEVLAWAHADDSHGFAVPVGVFVFQEVQSEDWSTLLAAVQAAAPPGTNYSGATFTSIAIEDDAAGAQALFYRADLLLEDQAGHADLPTGAGRYTDRWKLRLVGYTDPPVAFYVYSSHLKANEDSAAERLEGVQTILADAAGLGGDAHVIFCGDLNFYHSFEDGYEALIAPGPAQALDPLGSTSWSGPGNAFKHTQSPRATGLGALIGGGLDDRFDFQLPTTEWHDGDGLALLEGTYRALGNDGAHYNQSINAGNNFYFPGDIAASNALADDLHIASDHLPLIADYQVPAVLSAFVVPNVGTVIEGASATVTALVSNAATPDVAEGAAALHYTAVGTGDVIEGGSGALLADGALDMLELAVDTSRPGPIAGTVTIESDGEFVQNPSHTSDITGTVLAPSNPSLSADEDADALTLTLDLPGEAGEQIIDVPVHNIGYHADQSLLDVDDIAGLGGALAIEGELPRPIGEEAGTVALRFDPAAADRDVFLAEILIHTSDEDLPGETTAALTLTLEITLGNGAACPADLDRDGMVDVADLLELLAAWGPCDGACPADLVDGNAVDVADLLALLSAWGACG